MSSKGSESFVACVVGLSLEHGESFGRRPGVGKSCLCHRFVHPGFDDYVSNHTSFYALHEFDSTVINNDHFLYWGSPAKTFPTTDSAKSLELKVHVIEHTVFYQDITSQPFNVATKPDKPDCYAKRITGAIESPGKVSYQSRDEVVSPADYKAEVYPQGISKLPRGFLVVIDVSQQHALFDRQLKRAEKVLEYLTKHKRKHVIVASKRDEAFTPSLEKVYELKKKFRTHVVEVSAVRNLNIDECFRVLAHKLLKKSVKLSSQVQTYPEAAHISLTAKGSARRSFATFLRKRIIDPNDELDAISSNEEYKECVGIIGKFEADKMFAEHILRVFNGKIDSYAGVEDNPEMREEFLEDFVEQRADLTVYMSTLREVIASIMRDVNSLEVEREEEVPEDYYDTPRLPEETPPDNYHIFQRASPVLNQQNEDNGYPQDGATGSSEPEERDVNDNDSYYSDSEGSEGPDYVNYDPRHPMQLPLTEESKQTPDHESPVYDEATSNQLNEYIPAPGNQQTYYNSPHHEPPTTQQEHTEPLLRPSEPPTRSPPPVRSKSPSIMSRAQILGNLLGHASPDPPTEQPTEMARPSDATASTSLSSETTHKALSPPPTTDPAKPKSPQRSIKKRAELLSSQLGHKPSPPTTKPKPSKSPAASRRAAPLSEHPQTDSAERKVSSIAKDLEGVLNGRNSSTDSDNESKRSVTPRSSTSEDKDRTVQTKTPPPVSKRVSSLPRGTSATNLIHTDSEDSNPGTPTGKRKPVRVAPPPPDRQQSSPDIPVTPPPYRKPALPPPDRRKSIEYQVTPPVDRKQAPTQPPPAQTSEESPPTLRSRKLPPVPVPPNRKQSVESPVEMSPSLQPAAVPLLAQDQFKGSSDKPRLQAIRQKIERNKMFQTEETVETTSNSELNTPAPPPVSMKPVASRRRKDYEMFRPPRVDEPDTSRPLPPKPDKPHPLPPKPEAARPQPVLPPLPEQTVKPHFVSVDIDRLKSESASPPPLPPRLIPEPPMDDELPPALPKRTKEMLIIEDIPSKRTGRPEDYQNVLKQNAEKESPKRSERSLVSASRRNKREKSSSSDSEPVTSPVHVLAPPPSRELPPIPSSSPVPRRSQFLVMRNRPLPLEPFAKPDEDNDGFPDDTHDYEQFDFGDQPPVKQHSANSTTIDPSKVIKHWSFDASSTHSTTRQTVVDVSQSLNLPSHSSLKKASTFNSQDKTRPLVTDRLPLKIPKGIWPEYIDGYVNPEPPPPGYEVERRSSPPVQTRKLPLTPFEMSPGKQLPAFRPSHDPDYDYPELRTFFKTLPSRGSKAAAGNSNIPIPPRFPPAAQKQESVDKEDADDYIHMQTQFQDDSYMNSDIIEQIRAEFLGPSRGQPTHAVDDMGVYMNLPAPPSVTLSLPPRHQKPPTSNEPPALQQQPSVLPRRGRAATTLEDVHPTMVSELLSRVQPSQSANHSSPFLGRGPTHSQSLDEQGISGFNEEGQVYINVSESLPAAFVQGGDVSPRVPVRSTSKREPVPAPIIGLPPRNIKRNVNN